MLSVSLLWQDRIYKSHSLRLETLLKLDNHIDPTLVYRQDKMCLNDLCFSLDSSGTF